MSINRLLPSQCGSVLGELSVVMPLLAMLIFCGLELTRLFQVYEQMSSLSHEAANTAFRTCPLSAAGARCLSDVKRLLDGYAEKYLPGAEIVISIFVFDAPGNYSARASITGADPESGRTPAGNQSRFPPQIPAAELTAINTANPQIVIAELFYRVEGMTSLFARIFGSTSKVIYEATIY